MQTSIAGAVLASALLTSFATSANDPRAAPGAARAAVPTATASTEEAFYRDWLRRSGTPRAKPRTLLLQRATRLLRSWADVARDQKVPLTMSPPSCFEGGCLVTVNAPTAEALEEITTPLSLTEAFRTWPGSKWRGPPRRTSRGGGEVDWILFTRAPGDPDRSPQAEQSVSQREERP